MARVGWCKVNLPRGPPGDQVLCVCIFSLNQQISMGPGSWILCAPFYRYKNLDTGNLNYLGPKQALDTLI